MGDIKKIEKTPVNEPNDYDDLPIGVFLMDIDGYCIYANQKTTEIIGMDRKDILGLGWVTSLHIDDRINVLEHWRKFTKNYGMFKMKYRFKHPNGKLVWVISQAEPYKVDSDLFLGTLSEITDEVKNKDTMLCIDDLEYINNASYSPSLTISENKILKIVQTRKEVICIISKFGEVSYVSPSCQNISGYLQEEVIGTNIKDYIHPKDLVGIIHQLEKIEEGDNLTFIYRFRKKDNSYIWKEGSFQGIFDSVTDELKEIVIVSRDITEKKEMEDILRESEKRYRLMMEGLPDGVFAFKKGKWIYVNNAGLALLGADKKEKLLGKSIYKVVSDQKFKLFKDKIREIYKGKKISIHEEKWIRLDGNEIDVEVVGYPIVFEGKTAYQFIVRDITEKKKMKEIALLSEKLNTAGELAAGIAHEIRNPLTSLKGFLKFIEEGNFNKEYFTIMESEINRINIIVSQLLAASKPEISTYSNVIIQELINEVIDFLAPQALLNKILIKKELEIIPINIRCNAPQIKQVLINMMKNSMEAMLKGGNITVILGILDEDNIVIKIIDEGKGIPKDTIAKIGQPFFTTKRNGTGLGMMVSFSIIKNHDGNINIYSEEGKGSTFEIILPLHNNL